MTNDLRQRLEALSAKATQGEWFLDPTEECTCSGTGDHPPVYEQDYCAQILTDDPSLSDNKLLSAHENADAVVTIEDAALICALVNRFRSGDLVTRSEMEEAVAKTNAMLCDAYGADVRGTELFQEELEAEVSKVVAKAVLEERANVLAMLTPEEWAKHAPWQPIEEATQDAFLYAYIDDSGDESAGTGYHWLGDEYIINGEERSWLATHYLPHVYLPDNVHEKTSAIRARSEQKEGE